MDNQVINLLNNSDEEYIYLKIPKDYVCLYNKILILMSKYGIDMLRDCQAGCSSKNKTIISCFNMFNAAISARALGLTKESETIIKYINGQLKILNRNNNIFINDKYFIDNDGYLKAIINCTEKNKLKIDPTDGNLYEEQITNENKFNIEDSNLIVKK